MEHLCSYNYHLWCSSSGRCSLRKAACESWQRLAPSAVSRPARDADSSRGRCTAHQSVSMRADKRKKTQTRRQRKKKTSKYADAHGVWALLNCSTGCLSWSWTRLKELACSCFVLRRPQAATLSLKRVELLLLSLKRLREPCFRPNMLLVLVSDKINIRDVTIKLSDKCSTV